MERESYHRPGLLNSGDGFSNSRSSPKTKRAHTHPKSQSPSLRSKIASKARASPSLASVPLAPSSPPSSVHSIPVHPFANTKAKLELLPSSYEARPGRACADGSKGTIDIAEEARLYDELCRSYEDDTDSFTRSNTPVRHSTSNQNPSRKLIKAATSSKTKAPAPATESIFSADIFLADNTGHLISNSPAFAQEIRIAGWTTVGDGAGKGKGIGAYVVYDCVILTKEGTTMHILKRYSAFEELHDTLRRTVPRALLPSIPTLPPKAPLARFRPAFLDSRRKLLEFWLTSVLLHPELGGREVVRDWVLT